MEDGVERALRVFAELLSGGAADDAELLGGELHAALEGGGIRDLERVILFETSWVRRANLADAAVHP